MYIIYIGRFTSTDRDFLLLLYIFIIVTRDIKKFKNIRSFSFFFGCVLVFALFLSEFHSTHQYNVTLVFCKLMTPGNYDNIERICHEVFLDLANELPVIISSYLMTVGTNGSRQQCLIHPANQWYFYTDGIILCRFWPNFPAHIHVKLRRKPFINTPSCCWRPLS